MKKYILPFMSFVFIMTMAGCSSSDDVVTEINEVDKLVPMTFTATQESSVGTRSALDNSNNVVWQTNDKISVFDGKGNQLFTLTGDVALGKFSGSASSDATSYIAVYPYTEGATLNADGSVSGISLPSEQTAIADSFDPNAALMMAVSSGANKNKLDFKNAVSLVKVTTEFSCKKIVLSANEVIAGTGTLKYNTDAPSISLDENQSKSITLKPVTDATEIAVGTYYIVVPAVKLTTGWSISFTSTDNNVYTRSAAAEVTFNRSKMRSIGTFKTSGTWTHTSRGDKVAAAQEVDLGLTIQQEGKTYKVIFAKSNLTATGLAEKESDFGDYFAWGATEPLYDSYTLNGTSVTNPVWKVGKTEGYVQANAPLYNGSSYTKYTSEGETLDSEHDAASQILGGDWQIPTKEILEKLSSVTQSTAEINNIQGVKFSNNSAELFLPWAGEFNGEWRNNILSGCYWSNTTISNSDASVLEFISEILVIDQGSRYCGFTIRPIRLVEE